jgi:hypothetical protein
MATGRRLPWFGSIVVLLLITFATGWVVAKAGIGTAVDPASLPELERQFAERMHGSVMVGFFTVAGREDRPARPDRYEIASVEKVGDDRWRFNTRMKYGDRDIPLPVTVTMRWVDDTPMIMLTDFTIPSMGTFGVRLFFYADRYAGTWQHERVGGHMFGRIEKQAAAPPPSSSGQ